MFGNKYFPIKRITSQIINFMTTTATTHNTWFPSTSEKHGVCVCVCLCAHGGIPASCPGTG